MLMGCGFFCFRVSAGMRGFMSGSYGGPGTLGRLCRASDRMPGLSQLQ